MKFLQNILVTVDLSESTEFVIENAISLAKIFNSKITLMHVIPDHPLSSKLDKFIEESVTATIEKLNTKVAASGIEVSDSVIEHGAPFEKIIQEAQNNDYNVIVVGSGSKKKEEAYKLGITVEKLIRKNQVPVWVVKSQPVKEIKKILCPIDFSDASLRAVNNAVTLAQNFDAELLILHTYLAPRSYSIFIEVDYKQENINLESTHQHEFDHFLEQVNLDEVKHKKVMLEGAAHQEILQYIKENSIDLLLMGTTGKTGLSRILMGSTTEKVIRELPCSFITMKAKDITDDYFESNLKSLELIINSAKQSYQKAEYDRAIEKYSMALKQHPDNIPVLMGLIECYQSIGNQEKAKYYKRYGQEVVDRIWGDKYLSNFTF